MSRPKERTDLLTPIFALRVRSWGLSLRSAKAVLGIEMSDADFWRVMRSDEAKPDEVQTVAEAIIQWGKDHNMPGWQELEQSK